jgi:cobyrinic acid a,c-diamide synthase
VHRDDRFAIVERHLGLMPSNEANAAREKIDTIATLVAASVDLDRLIAVSSRAPALAAPVDPKHALTQSSPESRKGDSEVKEMEPSPSPLPLRGRGDSEVNPIKVGIPRDAAFAFYYPGDLEALRGAGAELVTIDTLKDARLPDVDALFIGGGFPEVFMEQLEANASLRHDIRRAIENGLPAYAECGGLMYLARSISWRGKRCEMAGVIPGDVVMHDRPMGRGYVQLRETGKNPWPLSGSADVRAHEFHYSSLENLAPGTDYAYDVMRGNGVDGQHDGIVHKNLLACYAHLRDLEDNHWTRRFVQFVRQQRRTSGKHQAAR